MNDFEHFEPATLNKAITLLTRYKGRAKLMAGGTDLLVQMKHEVTKPDYVVNLKSIPDLDYICYDDQRKVLRIGSLTTLHSLETSPLMREKTPILSQVAQKIAAPRLRNTGTIGGNLCQDSKCLSYATTSLWNQPSCYRGGGDICYVMGKARHCLAMATAETAPALICLDARIKTLGPNGERSLTAERFFVSAGVTDLGEDEILTEIEIPDPPTYIKGVYLKYSRRDSIDFAIVGVATMLGLQPKTCTCDHIRISLLGVARIPIRVYKAEEILKGKLVNAERITQAAQAAAEECHPLGDIYASARLKRTVARELVKRAIIETLDAASR